jgi:hypothetical protein
VKNCIADPDYLFYYPLKEGELERLILYLTEYGVKIPKNIPDDAGRNICPLQYL